MCNNSILVDVQALTERERYMQNEQDRWTDNVLTYGLLILLIPALVGMFDGAITFGSQVIYWLRVGEWVPQTLWDGLHKFFLTERPELSWAVPNRILNYILELPRAGGMFFLGVIHFILISLLISFVAVVSEKAREIWTKRHEEPIFIWPTFTRREKINIWATVVWLLAFPAAVALAVPDTDKWKVWGDMVGVGAVIAFWFWAIVLRFKKEKTDQ
jgi:hypothetical protein